MQLNTRTFITLLIAGVGTIYLYYGLSGDEIRPKTDTHKQIVSYEIVETDTGKRLETYANSGTDWGMTPFGSGKPLEEMEEEKLVFQKPNTEWKTRTISGVTYVFGEGNPKEVALLESEIRGCSWQEGGIPECTDNGAGYVDPLLEKLVYDVLNSSDWEPLLQNCEKELRHEDEQNRITALDNGRPEFVNFFNFDSLSNLHSYISMEDIFIINSQTGRKNISREGYDKLIFLRNYLWNATWFANANDANIPNPNHGKCVDTFGTNIINTLSNIRSLPWRGSKDIPPEQG